MTPRQEITALRDFDLAYVACGSFATETVEAKRPAMSVSPPKADN